MPTDTTYSPYHGLTADLTGATLLRLEAGERLWKLYFLRPASGPEERVEHRIYTKEQLDGHIGLVSYTLRMPPEGPPARANLAYAKDIPTDTLNHLIWNVVRQAKLGPEELEIIDLSGVAPLEEQLTYLRELDASSVTRNP
jgi:hypothetical protein